MSENWLPVVGFEGLYEVSDRGRVRSLERRVPYGDKATIGRRGRVLKSCPVGKGHLAVALGRGNRRKVHLLVLEAFVGPRPKGLLGLHNDGDVTNNRLSNLRWDTYSANNLDAVKHGTHHWANKTHCPKGHSLDGVTRNGGRFCKTCHNERGKLRDRRATGCQMPGCKNSKTRGQANRYCDECRVKAKEIYKAKARRRAREWHAEHRR